MWDQEEENFLWGTQLTTNGCFVGAARTTKGDVLGTLFQFNLDTKQLFKGKCEKDHYNYEACCPKAKAKRLTCHLHGLKC